jgi:hypothetical protein
MYGSAIRAGEGIRDGFRSDTHGNESECHYLPYFNSNTNTIEYEYKTDSSNSDLHSDT